MTGNALTQRTILAKLRNKFRTGPSTEKQQLCLSADKMLNVLQSGPKISGCIAGCNFVSYGPISRNYTVRKLTKFLERCM